MDVFGFFSSIDKNEIQVVEVTCSSLPSIPLSM